MLDAGVAAPCHRVWRYQAPAVVLGCSQRALHEGMAPRLAGRAALIQRESGGGAVLAGPWMVGLSLALPAGHAWARAGVVGAYEPLAQVHRAALGDLGIAAEPLRPAEVAAANAALPTVRWACFGSLSPWELVAGGGRKLVGLAQRRRRDTVLLVAGTLVDPPDWPLLCEAAGQPADVAALQACTVSCRELAGRPLDAGRLAAALAKRLDAAFGPVGG